MNLFDTGIRPAIDAYLAEQQAKIRDYGDYWSASSAGYCMRKLIFERLGVPPVVKEDDARKTRVFEAGHVFHEWAQRITKNAGLSIAQELELQDEDLMVRGHIDDLVLIGGTPLGSLPPEAMVRPENTHNGLLNDGKLILYDYKTQHANAFTWQKGRPPSYYHKMQAGTYMYMLRKEGLKKPIAKDAEPMLVAEARILKISKDDLRMDENQILWDVQLENDVKLYWDTLNGYWKENKLPSCSCHLHEGGFMAKEKFNPYFYDGEPCSLELYKKWKAKQVKEKA